MTRYVSEFDQWLLQFKKDRPDIEHQQQEGRNLLWDKRPEEIEKIKNTINNKQSGYVYYK
jgi:hypothetical protein